jgi:hypothetical protein
MSPGARSQPPELPNFTYQSWLGGGGFADVFLYRQLRPARDVAVKVLRTAALEPHELRAFDAEADLMARVSAHPYIVTIYGAEVAPDGRPYLVMEYYSKPHFGQRARQGPLSVPEVLRVGVRIASAVETAHRAGILHRDIKPANILVNQYDRPGLTDFGIAGAREGTDIGEAAGVTVAYAPPEVLLDESPGDELGDVYSLAATLYALLAGHAPFEATGGDNGAQAVLNRTLSGAVAPIHRPDLPRTLELLLAQAMSKKPAHRPASAAAFGRALQGIERELQLAVTEFELAGEEVATPTRSDDDADGTRANRVQVVRPTGPRPVTGGPNTSTRTAAGRPALAPISGVPRTCDGSSDPGVPTFGAPAPIGPPPTATPASEPGWAPPRPAAEPRSPRRPIDGRRAALLAGAAIVVLGAVAALIASASGGDGGAGPTTPTTLRDDSAASFPDFPDTPTDVKVVLSGGVAHLTWEADDAEEGDTYLVTRGSDDAALARVSEPQADIQGVSGAERTCFSVIAERGSRQSDRSVEACT